MPGRVPLCVTLCKDGLEVKGLSLCLQQPAHICLSVGLCAYFLAASVLVYVCVHVHLCVACVYQYMPGCLPVATCFLAFD